MAYVFSEPKENRFPLYFRPLVKLIFKVAYGIECHGRENIPEEGGVILAPNHIAYLDPVMVMTCCKRVCHFMAKHDLFDRPVMGPFLVFHNTFPVKRGLGDKAALGHAVSIINKGWVLGIFPEGTRALDFIPKEAKSGVAYLAHKTKAPVVPISIHKERNKKFRPKIIIRIGKPIEYSEFGFDEQYKSSQMRAASKKIMDEIKALWQMDE